MPSFLSTIRSAFGSQEAAPASSGGWGRFAVLAPIVALGTAIGTLVVRSLYRGNKVAPAPGESRPIAMRKVRYEEGESSPSRRRCYRASSRIRSEDNGSSRVSRRAEVRDTSRAVTTLRPASSMKSHRDSSKDVDAFAARVRPRSDAPPCILSSKAESVVHVSAMSVPTTTATSATFTAQKVSPLSSSSSSSSPSQDPILKSLAEHPYQHVDTTREMCQALKQFRQEQFEHTPCRHNPTVHTIYLKDSGRQLYQELVALSKQSIHSKSMPMPLFVRVYLIREKGIQPEKVDSDWGQWIKWEDVVLTAAVVVRNLQPDHGPPVYPYGAK